MRSGVALFIQQLRALVKKNALIAWRQKRSTILSILSPLIFLFVLFAIDRAIQSTSNTKPEFNDLRDPVALIDPVIPPCEDTFSIRKPCFDFVWSARPTDSSRINDIVNRIMANNPGRPIPPSKVKSFATPEDVDKWMYDNPQHCSSGALHFTDENIDVIGYGLQTNSSASSDSGSKLDSAFIFSIPLQIAAEREIARTLLGDDNFNWTIGFKEYPHPAETKSEEDSFGMMGAVFLSFICVNPFINQLNLLVQEKELRLRQAMNIMGLYDSAYWASWLIWQAIMICLYAVATILSGMIYQYNFFLHNSFPVLFLVFFLYQLNMFVVAMVVSTLLNKASAAQIVGTFVMLFSVLVQVFMEVIEKSKKARAVSYLFPPAQLSRAINMLQAMTKTAEDPGISWGDIKQCPPLYANCTLSIQRIYLRLLRTTLLWLLLALYLDNVIPSPNGLRKSMFYFLNPAYWTGRGGIRESGGPSVPGRENITPDDEDVKDEEFEVRQQAQSGVIDPSVAVQIRGLFKVYFIKKMCKGTTTFHAVKGLWMNLHKNQLFCLLGPNGAGKTTTISCLTGITSVTGGDALIYGNSIRSSVGMSNSRKIMGVCPQFDILWRILTGEEHLRLFAYIKGLPPSSIGLVVAQSLEEVKLTKSATVRAGSYSGGMRRRLSVAIALLGDPKLVILDEPTTGMDPISRRQVWDIIENAKEGRVIILTTHSMEEADILGDRIGIMAKGRLRCIGTSVRLKSKFGTGFIANVSFSSESNAGYQESVKHYFKQRLDLEPKDDHNKAFLTYVIPREKEQLLKRFFEELQRRRSEFGVSDIQLGLTTLEEVFLNIARQAEVEAATAEGRMETLTIPSGPSVKVPVGARYVAIPGTESPQYPNGIMVELHWDQDESGSLCISSQSAEMPVPPHVQLDAPVSHPGMRVLGGQGSVPGIVIDPRQIHGRS